MSYSKKDILSIAKVCHETNKAYCETLGDNSQDSWENCEDWQKQSAINGVMFHLSNNRTPEESHHNWLTEKIENGWVYGKEKNIEKKTHPCLVSYDELPKEQQIKDKLFSNVVSSFKTNTNEAYYYPL